MPDYTLDLALLAEKLRGAREENVETLALDEVNPYLWEVIFPLLMQGTPPRLRDVDFGLFDVEDPGILAGYCQDHDRRAYTLAGMNRPICTAEPGCAKVRAFI